MASLYPVKGGWKIAYRVGDRRCYTTTIHSRKLARKMLADLEHTEEAIRLGLIDARQHVYAVHALAPLAKHVEAWRKSMSDRGLSKSHCDDVAAIVLRVCRGADFDRIADLTVERVQAAIRARGNALGTANNAVASFKGFSRWLHKSGRTGENQLRYLVKYNAAMDPKRRRRDYTPEEAAALIGAAEADATATRPYYPGGRDRAMLYRTALGTGLRLRELLSLTARSLHLMGTHPYVELAARDEKNRKGSRQPIPPELARRLRDWVKGRGPDAPLWHFGADGSKPWRAFVRDRKAAGIVSPDAEGMTLDFHGLRHTYITWGLRAGIPLRVMQHLARHSDPKMTARYGHVGVVDVDGALGKLPDVGDVKQQKKEQA